MEECGLADKVDKLLRYYFSGKLEKQIKSRKMYLQFHHDVDENIGGGRAQYKYDNAFENAMIKEESDFELKNLNHQKMVIEFWLTDLEDAHYDMLKDHYGTRKTWPKIAMELHVGESTLHKWKNEFKQSISHYVDL